MTKQFAEMDTEWMVEKGTTWELSGFISKWCSLCTFPQLHWSLCNFLMEMRDNGQEAWLWRMHDMRRKAGGQPSQMDSCGSSTKKIHYMGCKYYKADVDKMVKIYTPDQLPYRGCRLAALSLWPRSWPFRDHIGIKAALKTNLKLPSAVRLIDISTSYPTHINCKQVRASV